MHTYRCSIDGVEVVVTAATKEEARRKMRATPEAYGFMETALRQATIEHVETQSDVKIPRNAEEALGA